VMLRPLCVFALLIVGLYRLAACRAREAPSRWKDPNAPGDIVAFCPVRRCAPACISCCL